MVDIPLPWEWKGGGGRGTAAGRVLVQWLTALPGHTGKSAKPSHLLSTSGTSLTSRRIVAHELSTQRKAMGLV